MTNSYNGRIFFKSDTLGRTINLTGKTLNYTTYFDGAGSWTLAATFAGASVVHSKGSIITNNFAVTCTSFSSSTAYTRQLSLGSSVVTINGNWQITNGTGYTINAGTSVINISGTFYNGGNLTYNNVSFSSPSPISFYSGNTYDTFSASEDISFEGGKRKY